MLKASKMTEYDLHYLSESPLFSGVGQGVIKAISSELKIYEYNSSENIFQEKSNGTDLFLIIRGQIEIIKKFQKNKNFLITVLSIKDFFGEMAFLTGCRRSASAVARTNCRLLVLPPEDLEKDLFADYSVKANIITNIAHKLALDIENLNNEYARIMNIHGKFFQEHHKKNIADLSHGISQIRNRYLR